MNDTGQHRGGVFVSGDGWSNSTTCPIVKMLQLMYHYSGRTMTSVYGIYLQGQPGHFLTVSSAPASTTNHRSVTLLISIPTPLDYTLYTRCSEMEHLPQQGQFFHLSLSLATPLCSSTLH